MRPLKLTDHLARFIIAISTLSILTGCLIMVAEVVFRDLFGVSIVWAEETTRYLTIGGVFLLVGPLVKDNSHIKVVFVHLHLPKKVQKIVDCSMSLLGMIVCGICVFSSKDFIELLREVGAKSISGTPFHPWTWQVPAIVGFVIGAIYFFEEFLTHIKKIK